MDLIHIETEEIRDVARVCETALIDWDDAYSIIRTAAFRLEAGWQGGSADTFQADLQNWLRIMAEEVNLLDRLARMLARQADDWEELDQRWSGAYRDMLPILQEEAVKV